MRKKTQNKELAKRAKKLVEKWRAQVLSNNHIRRALNSDSPTNIMTNNINGIPAAVVRKDISNVLDKSLDHTESITEKLSRKRKKVGPENSPSYNSTPKSFSCKLNSPMLTINHKLDPKLKSSSVSSPKVSQVVNCKQNESPKSNQISQVTRPPPCSPIVNKKLSVKKQHESLNESVSVQLPFNTINTLNKIPNIPVNIANDFHSKLPAVAAEEKTISCRSNEVLTQIVTPDEITHKIKNDSSLHLINNDILNSHKKIYVDKGDSSGETMTLASADIMISLDQNFTDKEIELLNNNIELNTKTNKALILESHCVTIEAEDLAVCRNDLPNDIVNPESLADGINGIYDKGGGWKSWTDKIFLRNNELCILPYVVLD